MADLTFKERAVLAAIAFYDGPGGAWPSRRNARSGARHQASHGRRDRPERLEEEGPAVMDRRENDQPLHRPL